MDSGVPLLVPQLAEAKNQSLLEISGKLNLTEELLESVTKEAGDNRLLNSRSSYRRGEIHPRLRASRRGFRGGFHPFIPLWPVVRRKEEIRGHEITRAITGLDRLRPRRWIHQVLHRLSLYALRVVTGLDPRPTAASIRIRIARIFGFCGCWCYLPLHQLPCMEVERESYDRRKYAL